MLRKIDPRIARIAGNGLLKKDSRQGLEVFFEAVVIMPLRPRLSP